MEQQEGNAINSATTTTTSSPGTKRRKLNSTEEDKKDNSNMTEVQVTALRECALKDGDDVPIEITAVEELSREQRCRYIAAAARCPANLEQLGALRAVKEESSGSSPTVAFKVSCAAGVDHVAVVTGGASAPTPTPAVSLVLCDDGVSYDSLSPLQLVEYTFSSRKIHELLLV